MAPESPVLSWSESFDEPSLSPQRWNFDEGDGSAHGLVGWGNNELQFYTEDSLIVNKGLKIRASKQSEDTTLQCYYGPAKWRSGKIHTANKVAFKYGLIEVRAQMPKGKGTWPALWLLGNSLTEGIIWPFCGEIDIFEGVGNKPHTVRGTIHGPEYFGEEGITHAFDYSDELSSSLHTYAISWEENRIAWLFDGQPYFSLTPDDPRLVGKVWPFNESHYLIINLAIGGWFGGEVDPDLTTAELKIEWIHHSKINGVGEVLTSA